MPLRNRWFLVGLLLVLLVILTIVFAPSAISSGVRLWVWWAARQEGFIATIDDINAPFLRPVSIRGLHLKSSHDDALRVELGATDASVGLNFKHLLLHRRGHIVRTLSVRDLHVRVRRSKANVRALSQRGWATLQRLLPQDASFVNSEVRFETGPTLILLRSGLLTASETEAGRFSAAEVMVVSPWVRQSFSQLRGATHWEGNRLTIGGLTLSRGLDLQSATTDLSRLGKQRVGLQFDVDAFGGKIRGNIAHEWRTSHSNWKVAGAANDISLAQTSDAFGFAGRVNGLLHAANFTFRGNLSEPERVTASLWGELTGLTWRNRTAEAIMMGAAVYNRKVELQQLYIRQKTNQFTLSGEAAFPSTSSGWLSPDFRGNISASIYQLGEFVALFGANPADFAGKITIQGAMDTRDRRFGGRLAVDGSSLTIFQTAIERVIAKLNLQPNEMEIEQFEMRRKNDSLTGQGNISMSGEHKYSGTLQAHAANLLDYFSSLRRPVSKNSKPIPAEVQATITSSKWDTSGVVRLPDSSPVNFTAKFDLPVGTDWNAFQLSPVTATIDFPSVFLAKAPQLFHPAIFQDGILSGNISFSETLQHPCIVGDLQLVNGKLSGDGWTPANLVQASSRVAFDGNRASVEFFNAATSDVDLSLQGEITFEDPNAVIVRLSAPTPMFDLTTNNIGCVNKIKVAPTLLTLAPAVSEFVFRGSLFHGGWSMSLQESASAQTVATSNPDSNARDLPLCLEQSGEEKTLLLGALPRSQAAADTSRGNREDQKR